MSSRIQTQSLDRYYYRRKQKTNYPQNIGKVNNIAEHVVCHYHKRIEDIFSLYSIKRFSEELLPEKLMDVFNELVRRYDRDIEDLTFVKHATKETFGDELLHQYIDFISETKSLFHGISSRLSQTIRHGLIRYCRSFADYCKSEVAFVINYEKVIQNNSPEIEKEIDDIAQLSVDFVKYTLKTKNIFYNCTDLCDCIGKIRACINKLYYLVTEWVDEERNYPNFLTDEMKEIKSQLFTNQYQIEITKCAIENRRTQLPQVEKHIKIQSKNLVILRRKYQDVEYSQEQIDFKMKRLKDQETCRDSELLIMNRSMEHLKAKQATARYKISLELKTVISEQRDLKSKQYRSEDNKLALYRHRERLCKVYSDIGEKIDSTKRDISINKQTRNRLRREIKVYLQTQNSDLEKLKQLQPVMDDLNFLFSKKYSPETLRQLHYRGKLILETKEINLMDNLCQRVAEIVNESWRNLYLSLPFFPNRSKEKRSHDIEIIDLLSAKNDQPVSKQAQMSLNKWRLFYHNATPEHLIEGLKKCHLNHIFKEIEDLYSKSSHRYDEL